MNYIKTFLLAAFILSCSSAVFAETITMTTYYPSPSGNYNNMTNNILTVTGNILFSTGGQTYFAGINGGSLYLNAGAAFNAATGMVVSNAGNIGIKKVPGAAVALDVNGAIAGSSAAITGAITGASATLTGALGAGAITGQTLTINPGASSLKAVSATTINATTSVTTPTLTVTGSETVGGALTVTGNITTTGGAFLHSSDERLKEDIVLIPDAIEKVKAINGVYFKYKGKEEKKMGLIAQNVEKVVPEVVVTDKDGMKSVDYSSLVALLIEAVKEQQVIIDELKEKGKK